MMTADEYIALVLDRLPRDTPMRQQIAMELRAHIDERVRQGRPLAEVLGQLGDIEKLAESYVAAIPREPMSFGDRAAAKLIDIGIALLPAIALALLVSPRGAQLYAMFVCVALLGCPILMLYTIVAEANIDRTIGKGAMGMCVIRETGTRIGAGQSIVRQLPWLLQIFWIDAFFALFTERHQRAFELLSKTRVVRAHSPEATP